MFKKKLALFLSLVILSIFLGACVEKTEEYELKRPGNRQFVTIATGGTAGAYYPLGGALSNIFNTIDGIISNSQATGASVENIGLVSSGEAEISFVQNDIAYYAWEGIESFEGKDKIRNIRGMSVLYPEVIQVIATKESKIEKIEDLRGKKVAVGGPGSGTEVNARQILEVHGLKYDDMKVDYLSFSEAADQIKNKQIDAAFVTAALPTSAVTEVTQTANIKIIPISKDKVEALELKYPYYTHETIKSGTYKNNDKDVLAAAVMAMLVVPEELDENLVYKLTKELYEQKEVIEKSHARGKDIKLEKALTGMPIEVHPGAMKYYNEKNIK